MLESGEFTTIAELAEREGIAPSCMTSVLRLTQLAPDITVAIPDGRQSAELQLDDLLLGFPLGWEAQCRSLAIRSPRPERWSPRPGDRSMEPL
jgi:hypothetical protein